MAEVKKVAVAKSTETAAPVKAESVKTAIVKAEVKKAEADKAVEKKVVAKKAPVKKAAAKKTPVKKAAAKKPATAKAALIESYHIQYGRKLFGYEEDKDLDKAEIVERCKLSYKEAGNKAAIKSIDVYVKPEENMVYYVINGVSGSIEV
ncbi:MAG: hypothetical protein GX567_10850 [Clostridia bacterium]|nr:hypothetical protein [Clostridia bacterium]